MHRLPLPEVPGARATTDRNEAPAKFSLVVKLAVSVMLLVVFTVCLALVFAVAAGLVWLSGVIAGWFGLPATALLVAALGVALCVALVFIASGISATVNALGAVARTVRDVYDFGDGYDDEDEDEA